MIASLRRITAAALVAVASTALPSGVHADMRSPSVLNPKTYRSPAGAYALTVDPSDMSGKGPASYRLTRGDRVVWDRSLPFTLWDAAVTDDGVVGGYAYTDGYDSIRGGDFRVVLLDGHGNVRLDHADRRAFWMIHGPAAPFGLGLFLDPANDRMVVRVYTPTNDGGESWRAYRLSDGADAGGFRPRPPVEKENTSTSIAEARPVASTPLTLVSWQVSDYSSPPARNRWGAQFALLDLGGKTVWHHDLPDDHGGDADEAHRLRTELRERGAILRTDQPGQFDVRFVADRARVTFAVAAGPGGKWSVREASRTPYSPPVAPKVDEPVIPLKPLRQLRAVRLGPDRPQPTIRDVRDLAIDDRGRLAFIRSPDRGAPALVVAEQPGGQVTEIELPADSLRKDDHQPHLAWVGGDRFVVVQFDWQKGRAKAWWVDLTTRQVSAVTAFDCQRVKGLAGTGDGGFVALATWWERTGSGSIGRDALYRFDAAGRRVWSVTEDNSSKPGGLFSPMDVAVTTAGRVAVLDGIRNGISLFDQTGKFERVIDLTAALGRKPNYPNYLTADLEGGLVVGDFNGPSPIVRLRADGTVHQQLTARFADGRTSPRLQSVCVAPDGRLWTTDGHALLRLDADGKVDRVVGADPDPSVLGTIANLAVDIRGGIYAVDSRTGTVHAFDRDGGPVRQFRPGPSDFEINTWSPDLTVSGLGEVFLGDRAGKRRLHFAADGTRLGWEPNQFDQVTESWHFVPGGTRRWVRTYRDVRILDGERTVRAIDRRPAGNWLERPDHVLVAEDGSAAVSSSPADPSSRNRPVVSLYTKDGDPVRTFTLPPPVGPYDPIAYGGDRLAAWTDAGIVLFDATGRPLWRFAPPADPGGGLRRLFLVNGGREMLAARKP